MSVPSVSAPVANIAAVAAQNAPVPAPRPTKSTTTAPAQSVASQPAATVTISDDAKHAVAANGHHGPPPPKKADASTQQTTTTSQTTSSGYVAKVRAALMNNPNLSISQAMSAAGVPQAQQPQVSAALGSAKQGNA